MNITNNDSLIINIRDINILWKLVFNNLYINRLIFKHLKLFYIYYYQREFKSIKKLLKFKYRDYLHDILVHFTNRNLNVQLLFPPNVESISTVLYDGYYMTNRIPTWLKSLEIQFVKEEEELNENLIFNSIRNSNLESLLLKFTCDNSKLLKINSTMFPITLKKLVLDEYGFPIKKETLPSSINNLTLIKPIGIIEKDSLSKDLTELTINEGQKDILKENKDVLSNLESLRILNSYGNKLYISNKKFIELNLTNSLKKLVLKIDQFPNTTFSENLEILSIYSSKKTRGDASSFFGVNRKENFELKSLPQSKLKTLELNCNGFIQSPNTNDNLPNSIKTLKLTDYCDKLKPDFLPQSLVYLYLGDLFNYKIGSNILPNTLKTLILGKKFNAEIVEGSLPNGLELLAIENHKYDKPIILSNPLTIVDCSNYFKQYQKNPEALVSFKVPNQKNSSFKNEYLKNYTNLQYLDISYCDDQDILKDLNFKQLKTLEIGYHFISIINLEQFQNLEVLKINNGNPTIITTNDDNQSVVITNTKNNEDSNNQTNQNYNFYKLKQIIVPINNTQFLDNSSDILIHFIKLIEPLK